jgi:hypothetical protein
MKIYNKKNELIFDGRNLQDADLRYANLLNADLQDADLQDADLRYANLLNADLRYANLRYANLLNADLRYANLLNANLRNANLRYANLRNANLRNANLLNADLPNFKICPTSGTFEAWKKTSGHIVKLQIPAFARRTSCLKNRKCRAELVKVLAIYGKNGKSVQKITGSYDKKTVYEVGKFVKPDSYCNDIRIDCSHGIHFFLTKEEAENW